QLFGPADCGDPGQCWQLRALPPSPPVSNECPQEQLETALGLCTVKPPPIRLSTKSISAPLMYWALTESTNNRTPPTSLIASPSSGRSSKPMPYDMPEQPPGWTKTRRPISGLPCFCKRSRNCVSAESVMLISCVSCSIIS